MTRLRMTEMMLAGEKWDRGGGAGEEIDTHAWAEGEEWVFQMILKVHFSRERKVAENSIMQSR